MRVRAHSRWHGRWVAVVVLAVALAAGCGGGAEQGAEPEQGGPAAEEKEMDQVTVQLDWLPRGNHGMFYVAKEKGWFAEQGIEVTEIQPGKGSAITMQIVGKNQADFGFGDLPTLAVARSQGIPVVALAAVNQESPLAMCTIESRHGLDNPEDLKGLRIGVTAGGSTFIFHQALLEANGLSRSDLKERSVTPPYESFLLEGHVDVVPCYIDAEVPILEAHAGEPLSILLGLDWGYDVLGSGLLTSEKMIDEDPELVQRFVNAYTKAFQWVIENPQEAAEIVAAAQPETEGQAPVFVDQLQADIDHTFTSEVTEENGFGWMSRESWEATVDVLDKQEVIKERPEIEALYTNEFVEKANEKLR